MCKKQWVFGRELKRIGLEILHFDLALEGEAEHPDAKTCVENGENGFLLRVASVAKRECDLQTNWMRPAPTRMIG